MDKHGVHGRCEGLLLLGSIHMIHTPNFFLNSMSLYGNKWRMREDVQPSFSLPPFPMPLTVHLPRTFVLKISSSTSNITEVLKVRPQTRSDDVMIH